MGFNYLQTDDRDDYFAQFRSRSKYPRYAIKRDNDIEWRSWFQKCGLIKIVCDNSTFTKKELKGVHISEILNILNNLGYIVHKENLPYITGYPKYTGDEVQCS